MNRNQVYVIAALVAIGVLAILFYPRILDVIKETGGTQQTGALTLAKPLTHQYKKGAHVYIGTVTTPTPCYEVSAEAIVRESYPEQVTIDVTITPPGSDVICIQVISEKKFKVAFQGSQEAVVEVRVNGAEAIWTSEEAPANINLEVESIE